MLRVIGLALLIAFAASIISGGNSTVVAIAFIGTIVVIAWGLLSGRTVLKCPHCRKRVKLGASTCHHCGAQVTNPRPLGKQQFDPLELHKECDHCKSPIRPDARVCAHCQRDVPAWTLHEGTWWREVGGGWERLNLGTNLWEPFEATTAAKAESATAES